LETNFFDCGRLFPPIFSRCPERQRPSACLSESALKIGGTPAVFKNCFQKLPFIGHLNRVDNKNDIYTRQRWTVIAYSQQLGIFRQMSARFYNKNVPNEENL
jgi:hypothetical protein